MKTIKISKEKKDFIQNYILNSIDFTGYNIECNDNKSKIENLLSIFDKYKIGLTNP